MKSVIVGVIVFLGVLPTFAADGRWVRDGLSVYWLEDRIAQLVDVQRIRQQQRTGCSPVATVRFGYSAALRGTAPAIDWSTDHRRRFAGAALTDRRETAYALLAEVLADPSLSADARAAAENQRMMTALMFNDDDGARAFLGGAPADGSVAVAIRADRTFVRALLAMRKAKSLTDWKGVDKLFQSVLEQDPSHFGARAERVTAWLTALRHTRRLPEDGRDACATVLRTFSSMVLDMSEAGPCPLLVGHADHVLSRGLRDASDPDEALTVTLRSPEGPWRVLVSALLAEVVGHTVLRNHAIEALGEPGPDNSPGQCRGLIHQSLLATTQALRGVAE